MRLFKKMASITRNLWMQITKQKLIYNEANMVELITTGRITWPYAVDDTRKNFETSAKNSHIR